MSDKPDPQSEPALEDDGKFWEEVERSQVCEFLFRAIVAPVVVYDARGRPIRANAAAVESYGLDPVSIGRLEVAKQFRVRYVDGRLVPVEALPTTRALRGEVVRDECYVFTNARGEARTILASVTPLWDGPQLRGAVSVWQDITQQLLAEEEKERLYAETKLSCELLDVVITEAPVGIALLQGPEHRYLLANPAYGVFIEGKGNVVGRTVAEVFPEITDQVLPLLDQVCATGESYHATDQPFRLWRKDRYEDVFVSFSFTPWHSSGGNVEGVLVLAIDTTDSVHIRQRLLESEERLKLFIEHAPAAIAMFDMQMRYLSYSHRWLTDYGLQGQDLHGRTLYEVFPEIPGRWKEIHRRCLAGAVERAEEDRFEWSDGRVQWLRGEVHPWYLASGQVGGIVLFTEDITERKQEQERLLEVERTRARLAQTMADEIAHRTKNNLAIVAGLLQTQIDRQADRPLDPGLVHDAIARIHTFAVLHEQMHQTQGEEVELVTALRRIVELNQQALSPKGTAISVEGEPLSYPSSIGANLCVVANELVTNALKYGAPDSNLRQVEIRLWREAGSLHLSVWNSGAPIASGFQVSKEAKTGLNLVHTVVEDQYGGAFHITPERGGTRAEIVLDDARLRAEV